MIPSLCLTCLTLFSSSLSRHACLSQDSTEMSEIEEARFRHKDESLAQLADGSSHAVELGGEESLSAMCLSSSLLSHCLLTASAASTETAETPQGLSLPTPTYQLKISCTQPPAGANLMAK
eukprot:222535-Hanusia_phi.AAC.2